MPIALRNAPRLKCHRLSRRALHCHPELGPAPSTQQPLGKPWLNTSMQEYGTFKTEDWAVGPGEEAWSFSGVETVDDLPTNSSSPGGQCRWCWSEQGSPPVPPHGAEGRQGLHHRSRPSGASLLCGPCAHLQGPQMHTCLVCVWELASNQDLAPGGAESVITEPMQQTQFHLDRTRYYLMNGDVLVSQNPEKGANKKKKKHNFFDPNLPPHKI